MGRKKGVKLSVTILMDLKGKWRVAAMPDVSNLEQRDLLRELTLCGGRVNKEGKPDPEGEPTYKRGFVLTNRGPGKRAKFEPDMPERIEKLAADNAKRDKERAEARAREEAEAADAAGEENVTVKPLAERTVKDLVKLIEDEQLDVDPKLKKADLVPAIEEALAARG